MNHSVTSRFIAENPKFKELVRRRSRLAWSLTAVILVVYFGFVALVAYGKSLLGLPIISGATTSIGFPLGIGVILLAFAATGIYVRQANGEFDELNRQIIEESRQ